MGADNNICLMGGSFFIGDPFFFGCHGTGDKDNFFINTAGFKHFRDGLEMLSCQHLRRHHQSALVAIFRCCKKCQDGNNRLTGTYITLD